MTDAPDRLREICNVGGGPDCCRYLVSGPGGITCAKLTGLRAEIDRRVAAGMFTARADNCDGLPPDERI